MRRALVNQKNSWNMLQWNGATVKVLIPSKIKKKIESRKTTTTCSPECNWSHYVILKGIHLHMNFKKCQSNGPTTFIAGNVELTMTYGWKSISKQNSFFIEKLISSGNI